MVSYYITQRLSVLSSQGDGETLELNKVSFNGEPAKWDIRRWGMRDYDGRRRMRKGIALSYHEIKALKQALEKLEDI